MPVSAELLSLVRCPKCHGRLVEENQGLSCGACRLLYPVVDGIPNFLVDEAKPLERK